MCFFILQGRPYNKLKTFTVLIKMFTGGHFTLEQGSATFYRQRAIWARLPQQGDR